MDGILVDVTIDLKTAFLNGPSPPEKMAILNKAGTIGLMAINCALQHLSDKQSKLKSLEISANLHHFENEQAAWASGAESSRDAN